VNGFCRLSKAAISSSVCLKAVLFHIMSVLATVIENGRVSETYIRRRRRSYSDWHAEPFPEFEQRFCVEIQLKTI
jgi:hypothetical protein